MPRMGGLELLEKLQQDKIKANVIMVSTLTTKDAEITMLAMERGAIDFVTKPTNIIEAKGIDFRNRLISVLEAVYQTRSQVRRMQNFSATVSQKPVTPTKLQKGFGNKLVALACSTGGPKALQSVIPYLPKDMNAPMVLVQHMPQGFTKSMADRLNEISPIRVKEAEHGDVLEKGCVYVAPGGKHMRITRNRDGRHVVTLSDEPAIGGLKPCADIMYESLRDCGYDEVTCVVLTGMGADGTKGILSLREKKDLYVISQSAETCVVYGMPKSIAETGVVDSVVPLAEVAQTIIKNVGVQ